MMQNKNWSLEYEDNAVLLRQDLAIRIRSCKNNYFEGLALETISTNQFLLAYEVRETSEQIAGFIDPSGEIVTGIFDYYGKKFILSSSF